ncbi:MAG: M23 family metallopeptidase [Chlorobiaceae bacterium]|nr:M23 family metallopeptidase [Chlorobiaceae bacterium]
MTSQHFHHFLLRLRRSALFRSRSRLFLPVSVLLVVLFFSVRLIHSGNPPQTASVSPIQGLAHSLGLAADDELGLNDASDRVTIDEGEQGPSETIEKRTVQRGDSIYDILKAAGLTPAEIHELTSQLKGDKAIRGFRAGKSYEVETNRNGTFSRFTWQASPNTTIHLTKNRETGKLEVQKETIEFDTRIATLEGTLRTSLAKELGSKNRPALTAQLNRILSSKINFRRDIQNGTTYKILYQEQWNGSQFAGTGDILAVEITTNGRKVSAYQFVNAKGSSAYYDEKGRALAQQSGGMYINPCSYSRVSSSFGYRIHPITKRRQFHGGVDLAAPTGTPVKAVADGRVIFRGRKGNAGNMVTIAHAKGVHTMYLHLSRFSPTARYGKSVRQGDVIGYVGSTGRSTGPHLDFRIVKNGRPQNPMVALKQKAPSRTLSKAELDGFLAKVQMYQEQFARTPVMVADASTQERNGLL